MLRELPQTELTDNPADYARYQFEAARAEWEAEEQNQPPCSHPVARLCTFLGYDRLSGGRTVRQVSCRICGQVLAGEID